MLVPFNLSIAVSTSVCVNPPKRHLWQVVQGIDLSAFVGQVPHRAPWSQQASQSAMCSLVLIQKYKYGRGHRCIQGVLLWHYLEYGCAPPELEAHGLYGRPELKPDLLGQARGLAGAGGAVT